MSQPIRVMFVDDEERILRSLALQFRRDYEVLVESDPRRALERLKSEPVHVLVSDQRMPQMSGSELLAQAAELQPNAVRILLTGYSDLDAAIEALNIGAQSPNVHLGVKITGLIDPSKNLPITLVFPKVKITRGMNLNFTTDNFGNMPFEFTPYSMVAGDALYNDFGTTKMRLLVA